MADARDALIAEIARDAAALAGFTGRPVISPAVLAAIRAVGREAFVPAPDKGHAWRNRPLPIGCGQTISQPFVVALMTDLLDLAPGQTVLEIGTGSGYQAAILAELGCDVVSIEIIPELAARARVTLDAMGYARVRVRVGDGAGGWPDAAPFDAIIATAAAEAEPHPWADQLRPGGRAVLPVGPPHGHQTLTLLRKAADGTALRTAILAVTFVPLTGPRGFPASDRSA